MEIVKRILTGLAITVFVLIGVAQCVGDSMVLSPPRAAPTPTLASGPEPAPVASSMAREAYLATIWSWSDDQPRVTLMDVSTDTELVAIALNVCQSFDEGMTAADVVEFITTELDQAFWEDAAVITGAAVGAYCPEYEL